MKESNSFSKLFPNQKHLNIQEHNLGKNKKKSLGKIKFAKNK